MRKVLIVDDIELNRDTIKVMLMGQNYHFLEASNGLEALDIIEKYKEELDAIVLDIVMPELDGVAVLEKMNQEGLTEKIPVLVISAENESNMIVKCFGLGVYDFISKPFKRLITIKRLENAISLFSSKNKLSETVNAQTRQLKELLGTQEYLIDSLKIENASIVDILGTVVESRNVESGQHIARVKEYTRILGLHLMRLFPEYGLTYDQLGVIVDASPLHDIGKIAIPDTILLKPGKLTEEEFDVIKTHTTLGADLIKDIQKIWHTNDRRFNVVSYNIARYHHERYTGKGYPDGLVGEQIPLCAQLVSVADVYDALINERCYKEAFSKDEAFDMIVNGKCGAFSDKMMQALRAAKTDFETVGNNKIVKIELSRDKDMLRLNTDVTQEVLTKMQEGIWEIVIPDGKKPQLYVNSVMKYIMGAPDGMTPEELYDFWESRVPKSESEAAMQYLKDIVNNRSAELTYLWDHPTNGLRYVRCGGYLNSSYEGGVKLQGYHRDVDSIMRK